MSDAGTPTAGQGEAGDGFNPRLARQASGWTRDQRLLAQRAVQAAVAEDRIRRQPCVICGDPKTQGHHAHGYDPEHWLDVVWLCSSHHIAIHVAVNPWAEARRAAGLSLRELEQRSGVNRGLLSLLERGRLIPTPDQAAVILRALTATTDETLR